MCCVRFALLDQPRQFDAAHVRHLHVEHDGRKIARPSAPAERIAAGLRLDQPVVRRVEDAFERQEVLRVVIDQQDGNRCGSGPRRSGRMIAAAMDMDEQVRAWQASNDAARRGAARAVDRCSLAWRCNRSPRLRGIFRGRPSWPWRSARGSAECGTRGCVRISRIVW